MKLIGREPEKYILEQALKSRRAELIAVFGRRRVGKTYLVQCVYKSNFIFEFSGILHGTLKQQLDNFHLTLARKKRKTKKPANWLEAFSQLIEYIESLSLKKKKVIFMDEFPWLDTRKSGFLAAFDNFWNSYAVKNKNLVVVICGSAASYMIQKIINNKGGLHNRITQKIRLLPFTLKETEQFLNYNNVKFTRYDILQLYMAMGGIPYYLGKISPGESVPQNIDRLCFTKDGALRTEFSTVFTSLFEVPRNHEHIIRILASVRKGLTRNEMLKKMNTQTGGGITKTLMELEESGFIEKYLPYQGTKDSLYRLTDEYSLFYLKFIEYSKPSRQGVWQSMFNNASYRSWVGFCFESVCIKHLEQIKEGLKIAGIRSEQGSWLDKKQENGAQIDLLIDRADNVINICEIKFYNSAFTIDKKYAGELAKKTATFSKSAPSKKNIRITLISTYGLIPNKYSKQYIQNELTMDDLFV